MKLACPACRADNTERICRRCKADLGMLWDLEADRTRVLAEAAEALRNRDWPRCMEKAQAALDLRAGADAAQMIACAYLLRGKFYRALEWHVRAATFQG